eukprot:TRINITY_DN998_c0_g1_i1.p1 TRINITY_DN998_c0_g1~~TRINITY_DN998_c0_g1_i1.p1  ORF type:complete len:226 (+),score=61.08 TRINITY_DN998_c0_g1_i1:57-734(+)
MSAGPPCAQTPVRRRRSTLVQQHEQTPNWSHGGKRQRLTRVAEDFEAFLSDPKKAALSVDAELRHDSKAPIHEEPAAPASPGKPASVSRDDLQTSDEAVCRVDAADDADTQQLKECADCGQLHTGTHFTCRSCHDSASQLLCSGRSLKETAECLVFDIIEGAAKQQKPTALAAGDWIPLRGVLKIASVSGLSEDDVLEAVLHWEDLEVLRLSGDLKEVKLCCAVA